MLACNDQNFIERVLPVFSRDSIFAPHELNSKSDAFYKPRLEELRKPAPTPAPAPVLQRKSSGLSRQSSVAAAEEKEEGQVNDDDYLEVIQPSVVSIGKRGGKGKRKSTGASSKSQEIWEEEVAPEETPVLARQSSIGTVFEWEQPCVDLLKKLTRHEFLDVSKSSLKVFKADFFRPVVELFPELADAYLEIIRCVSSERYNNNK